MKAPWPLGMWCVNKAQTHHAFWNLILFKKHGVVTGKNWTFEHLVIDVLIPMLSLTEKIELWREGSWIILLNGWHFYIHN